MEISEDLPRPRRVVVNGTAPVARVLDVVQPRDPALTERLLAHLQANVRTMRHEELPEEPLDEELAARVASLEQKAFNLSAQLGAARGRVAPLLEREAAEACARLTANANIEADVEVAKNRPPSALDGLENSDCAASVLNCISDAKNSELLCRRLELLRGDTATTRKRAGNALDALRIIAECDGAGDDGNNTVTISMDEPDSGMTIPVSPDARSNRRASRASLPGDPAVSPHITPRSKTRRRLLGSPGSKSKLPR